MKAKNIFHQASAGLVNPPTSEAIAVGYILRDFIEKEVCDIGTAVDQGAGFSHYDLWCIVGGKKLFISIKESQ